MLILLHPGSRGGGEMFIVSASVNLEKPGKGSSCCAGTEVYEQHLTVV